jgi:hypothetical protein
MKILRLIQKWLNMLLGGPPESHWRVTTSVDTHRWESKIEILGCLSSHDY